MNKWLLAASLSLVAGSAQAATVVNGSFESCNAGAACADPFTEVGVGNNAIAGWSVTSGTVDYIGNYWMAQNGTRSIDLAGSGPGVLSQTVADTVIGQQYSVGFFVSKNPDGPLPENQGTFSAGGQTYTFKYGMVNDRQNMLWQQVFYNFTATGTSSVISFAANTRGASPYGMALDNVSIAAVPEPATWAMLFLGFGMIGSAMRYRRRSTPVAYA